jgi:hypothetical protein
MDEVRQGPATEAPRHEHEGSDVNIRAITIFTVVLAATVGLVIIGTKLILNGLEARRPREIRAPASVERVEIPPAPLLQTSPREDLATVRAREDAVLDSYGWVDRSNGVVRIPIARAMDLVAREGLPVAPEGGAPPRKPEGKP